MNKYGTGRDKPQSRLTSRNGNGDVLATYSACLLLISTERLLTGIHRGSVKGFDQNRPNAEVKAAGTTRTELMSIARDRIRWRGVVVAQRSPKN